MSDFQLGPGPLIPEFEQVKSDIGIVENGNGAEHSIPSGSYVIWKGALYVATTDIPVGTTLSAESGGNLAAKTQGLGAEVAALNDNLIAQNNNRIFSNTDIGNNLNNATSPGVVVYTGGQAASMENAPFSGQGAYVLVFGMGQHFVQIAMNRNTGGITQVAFRACIEGTWTAWKKLTPS